MVVLLSYAIIQLSLIVTMVWTVATASSNKPISFCYHIHYVVVDGGGSGNVVVIAGSEKRSS